MKKKLKTPSELVSESLIRRKRGSTWFDGLSTDDCHFVLEVVARMREETAPVYVVADLLIDRLGIQVKRSTVVLKLKELLADGQ